MRLAVAAVLSLALLAAAPAAQAVERSFGATPEQLASPTPSDGADDCSSGCFFAGEPEHGPLSGFTFQPPDENANFPVRLDRAEIKLQNGGSHQISLLVVSNTEPRKFLVKDRISLGTHDGPGLINPLVSSTDHTVTVAENDWVGLYVVHAGQTDMIQRVPGSVKRAVGVNGAVGDTVDTDPTYGKNRLLPMRVHGTEVESQGPGPGEPGPGGSGGPGTTGVLDLSVSLKATTVTPGARVEDGHLVEGYYVRYALRVTNASTSTRSGPALASDVDGLSFEPPSTVGVISGGPSGAVASGERCDVGDSGLRCSVPGLGPGETANYRVRVYVPAEDAADAVVTASAHTTGCVAIETTCANNGEAFHFGVAHPLSRFLPLEVKGELAGEAVDATSAIRGKIEVPPLQLIPTHKGRNWVASVQVAGLQDARGRRTTTGSWCRWVKNRRGRLVTKKAKEGFCDAPVWLPAKLSARHKKTSRWRWRPRGKLPPGPYTFITRAIDRFGGTNAAYTKRNRNLIHLSAARCAALRICRRR